MQEHCGVNGACTRQSYDQFGRRRYHWEAVGKNTGWGSEEAAQVKWTYTAFGNGQKATTIEEAHNPRSEGNFVRRLYNGLGELIQEQSSYQNWSANDGKEIIVDYLYDPLGNQTRVSPCVSIISETISSRKIVSKTGQRSQRNVSNESEQAESNG